SALRLDNWVSMAFWSMVVTMLSGVMGRFLFTQLPKLEAGELEQMQHERRLHELRQHCPRAVAMVDDELADFADAVRARAQRGGVLSALLFVLLDDLGRPARALRRRLHVGRRVLRRADAREIARRAGAVRLLERRRLLTSRAKELLSAWKKVHV